MEAILRFAAILRADLRERTRSRRFWAMLALVMVGSWYCFPGDDASYVIFSTEGSRGFYSSAWVGLGMSLVLSFMLGLAGFYVVRGTLVRDFETRVWQLLVATPMTRGGFLLAKWASHMVVFLVIAALALAVGLCAQWVRAEDRTIDLIELVKPVLVISLPCMAISAMFAIWFDLLPWLRRTLGNVIFFFLFMTMMATPLASLEGAGREALDNWRSDPAGMVLVARDLNRVRSEQLGHDVRFGFNLGAPRAEAGMVRFDWKQWQPRPMDVLGRLLWLLAAMVGVLAAAPLLDWSAARSTASDARKNGGMGRSLKWLDRLLKPIERGPFGTLVAAELKLVLRQRRTWWWLAALGLGIAQLANTGENLQLVICLAWLLPLDVLARLALREVDTGTGALVFSSPRVLWRLLGVRFVVGLLLAVGVVLPALLKLLAMGGTGGVALLVISASLVAWGLALGLVCRNPRIFELLMLAITYVAIQGAAIMDVLKAPMATVASHGLALLVAIALVLWRWPRLADHS